MKGKLILCHVLCTAIGCIAGALAASGMGVFGGALLAVVVAAVLGAVGISKIVAEEEDIPTMKPVLKPAVQKAPAPVAPQPAKVQHSDMDLLGLSRLLLRSWGICPTILAPNLRIMPAVWRRLPLVLWKLPA